MRGIHAGMNIAECSGRHRQTGGAGRPDAEADAGAHSAIAAQTTSIHGRAQPVARSFRRPPRDVPNDSPPLVGHPLPSIAPSCSQLQSIALKKDPGNCSAGQIASLGAGPVESRPIKPDQTKSN
jgi:hypothetical protein